MHNLYNGCEGMVEEYIKFLKSGRNLNGPENFGFIKKDFDRHRYNIAYGITSVILFLIKNLKKNRKFETKKFHL